jgi:hypothetical protein
MRIVLSALVFLGLSTLALAQDTPRGVIEKAIAAHGGYEKLAAIRADKVKVKGTLRVGPTAMPFTNEMALQLPGQFKSVVTITEANRTHQIVHLLDMDKATILLDGQAQTVAGAHLAQLHQTLQLEQALRLVPLLNDSAFTLHLLPEVKYNTFVYAGVRITGKGQRDLDLYFDRGTGLLVKAAHRLDGPGGKDILQEAYYGDYRDLGGYRRPCKVVIFRDGKRVMEADVIEARRLERIDPVEFTRP